MPWRIVNNMKNQAEQITSQQQLELSTTIHTCWSAPNIPFKTNDRYNGSTALVIQNVLHLIPYL